MNHRCNVMQPNLHTGNLDGRFLCSLEQEDKIAGGAEDLDLCAVAIECRICERV
jgi:hypothetical protein